MGKNSDAFAQQLDGSRPVRLHRFDPADTGGVDKEAGLAQLDKLGQEFAELGNLLTYAGQHALLVVLQGRDASGPPRNGDVACVSSSSRCRRSRATASVNPVPTRPAKISARS